MRYAKKNLSIIIIILLSLLLIAIVIWMYDKRIESIEMKMKITYNSSQFNETIIITT